MSVELVKNSEETPIAHDRRAHATFFGIDFQINAAIVIMLEHIKEMDNIRLEGYDDIDIELNDRSHILAQAKSVEHSSTDFSNVVANFKKALVSLSEGAQKCGNVKQLIFITNTSRPFGGNVTRPEFMGDAHRCFGDLSQNLQDVVKNKLAQLSLPLDTSKFMVQILPFETDNLQERYKYVWSLIGDFIAETKIDPEIISRKDLRNIWASDLFKSGTMDAFPIHKTKKEVIWPLIYRVTYNIPYDNEDLDESERECLESEYRHIIDECNEKFEFVTSVYSDYLHYRQTHSGEREMINAFVLNQYSTYSYILNNTSTAVSDELKEKLIRVILRSILYKREKINIIKREVGL
ncbi:MAG: hypothetical protein KBS70_01025 [Bacteroidales bacterium]|nr:hypothetical protein [Candidatus Colicola equi]